MAMAGADAVLRSAPSSCSGAHIPTSSVAAFLRRVNYSIALHPVPARVDSLHKQLGLRLEGRSGLFLECGQRRRNIPNSTRHPKGTSSQVLCCQVANSATLNAGSKSVSSKLVLVVGATGGVGQFLVASLLEKGVKVRALVRSTDKARSLYESQLGDQFELRTGDVRKLEELDDSVFEGVTHVIQATGTTAFPSQRWSGNNGPEQTDWIAVRNFVDSLPKTLERVILVSSIAVTKYDKWPFFFLNLFGVLKYKKMGEDHLRKCGIPFTIIRSGRLPRGATNPDVDTRRKVVLGQGDTLVGMASREDVAEACVQSLDLDFTAGQTYELICLEGDGPGKDAEKWAYLFCDVNSSF